MSEIDEAREQLKAALFALNNQLRPQEASQIAADLAYLTPTLATLLDRINQRLADADRIPGLYSTANTDARAELDTARQQLVAAQRAVEVLTGHLEQAHQSLASLGHGDASDQPLTAVPDERPDWAQP